MQFNISEASAPALLDAIDNHVWLIRSRATTPGGLMSDEARAIRDLGDVAALIRRRL